MRRALAILTLLSLACVPSHLESREARIAAALRHASTAYQQTDWAGFLAGTQDAVALSPGNPNLRFRLARALARAGRAGDAVAELQRLAAMGLAYPVAQHPDLESVRALPAGREIAAAMERNRAPIAASQPEASLPGDLLVEAIARDPASGATYASSVRQGKIVRVDGGGAPRDVVTASDLGLFGIALDAQRGVLWVGAVALPGTPGYKPADEGRSEILRVGVSTGEVQRRYRLPGAHGFGDLALAPGGDLWASDNRSGAIVRVRAGGDALETVVSPGRLVSPQGIAFLDDGRAIVADYVAGLYAVDPAGGTVVALPAPDDTSLYGIDGLVRAGSALLAVQNGVDPARLLRVTLDAAATRVLLVDVVEQGETIADPTSGTVVGDRYLFVARSGWAQLDAEGRPAAGEAPPALIRSLALPH